MDCPITIRNRDITDSVWMAFGFGVGSKETDGPRHVNRFPLDVTILQNGGELSVGAHNGNIFKTLVLNEGEGDEKDTNTITFEEAFIRQNLRVKTTVYPDNKIKRTINILFDPHRLADPATPIQMIGFGADAERKRVKEIAALVIPLVRPFIGPSKVIGRSNLQGRGPKPAL